MSDLDFDTFAALAHEAFLTIPEEFRQGVDGLTVRPERVPHPTFSHVFTLGQCLTEGYPSDWSGPDTLRSVLVLYHGSFQALAGNVPDFDWEAELWETLTHELRHHLESLANEDDLEGVDYAMEEAFRRAEGEDDFDPLYYQAGLHISAGIYQVEYDFFLEQHLTQEEFETAASIEFGWHGERYRVPRPETQGDVHYLWVNGVEVGPGTLQVVLIRKRGLREKLRSWKAGGRGLSLWESEGVAEAI